MQCKISSISKVDLTVRRWVWICLVGVFLPCLVHAQVRGGRLDAEREYNRAYELFIAEKYAAAQTVFGTVLEMLAEDGGVRHADAAYYYAVCASRLGRQDAPSLLQNFAVDFPASTRYSSACYELGEYYYSRRKYAEALPWYKQVEPRSVGIEVQSEVVFKTGYCYFSLGMYDEAFALFGRAKTQSGHYAEAAGYYYGHIAYTRGMTTVALEEFQKLESDPMFSRIVPYYIAQIYYQQREYNKVIEYVTPRLDSVSGKRKGELERAVAESYFRMGEYEKALPYLEHYVNGAGALSRDDNYLAGFVYYRNEDYPAAARYFEQVEGATDSLSQNTYYHLADCYLHMERRDRACQALQSAASMDFDKEIQADAQFNYAKLTYELRYLPFADAVEAFLKFIETFPNSPRVDEAYTYLGMAFTETKNYQKALDALERIKQPNANTKRAMQRAAYFRGVELMQNLRFEQAEAMFARSLESSDYDPDLRAKALYWRAESLYRLQRYAVASKYYQDFLRSAGAYSLPQFPQTYYNLGYVYFKMRSYEQAIGWFRQFVAQKGVDKNVLTDALVRTGDCYYVQRKYWPAIEWYERAKQEKGAGADYALFQEGFALGLVARPEKKISALEQMDALFPNSLYRVEAYYEIATTYHAIDRLDEALRYYRKVVNDFPASPFVPLALVQIGLAEYALSHYDEATTSFKRVVSEYSGTPQMQEALSALERVHQTQGDMSPYFSYLETIGQGERVSKSQRDSLSYVSAENQYMQGDCSKAIPALRAYLNEYPQGQGSVSANYYLADCLLRSRDTTGAVAPLEKVIAGAPTARAAEARALMAQCYEYQQQWGKAREEYDQLEHMASEPRQLLLARHGRLRMSVRMGDDGLLVGDAESLLRTESIPPETALYANYHLGGALQRTGKLEEAYSTFASIGKNTGSATGAEARFRMAEIRHRQEDWARVQEEVLAFAKRNTPHQYWLAKAFILLAQAYEKQGDLYQARATLQSVLDNYDKKDDGIATEASAELARLQQLVHRPASRPQSDSLRFQFE